MTPTELRKALLANGYTPLANLDKRCVLESWPTLDVTEALIDRWARSRRFLATGLRIEDELAVIDFDIDHDVIDAIADRVFETLPKLGDPDAHLLVRRGKGRKEAWFVRTEEPFGRLHTRCWVERGRNVDDGARMVEVFGGATPRQFGAFGAHTVDADGVVQTFYRWEGRSPADTPKRQLPALTKKEFFAILDVAEAVLREHGFEPVALSQKGESDAVRAYDLTEDMSFDVLDGERVSLQQLRELAGTDGLRCSASWLEGSSALNRTRCIVGQTRSGNLTVWDSASGVTHLEVAAKPRDHAPEIDRLAEKLLEIEDRRKNRITSKDTALPAAAKLLATYAYCPTNGALDVVPLWATSIEDGMPLQKLRSAMVPHADEETGPRGGRVVLNPVDIWLGSERRVTVKGLRMRPDKPRPTYEDAEGDRWVNTYSPPAHDASGGSAEAGQAFLDYLLPDAEERRWFVQWLAHKVRHPYIPGPAVVMVARRQGTGRGTLGEIVAKLFGPAYVKQLPFHIFAGKSYQSQYDDWGASSLMVLVSESAETNGIGTYTSKRDTYEHLKEKVEPKPVDRLYVSKGSRSFTARHFTSYLIATNSVDALPIPIEDRRFAVLSNGEPHPDPRFWDELNAWIDVDANIAAFHRWLAVEVDLAGYSPFVAPPLTRGKRAMQDAAQTDLDRGLDLAFQSLTVEVYRAEDIVDRMRALLSEYSLDYPDRWQPLAKRLAQMRGWRVGVRDGENWTPMVKGKRYAVYATSPEAAAHWRTRSGLRERLIEGDADLPSVVLSNVVSLAERVLRREDTVPKK